jgi:hypothetical protein
MTDWQQVQRIRYAAGQIDETGTGRRAHAIYCPQCHALCIAGLDADRCAISVRCDPVPVPDPAGELAALLAGRRTYRLSWVGRYELDPRTPVEIETEHPGDPLNGGVVEVLVQHRCGLPTPGVPGHWEPRNRHAGPPVGPDDDPPF